MPSDSKNYLGFLVDEFPLLEVICQTRESVSSGYSNTEKRVQNATHSGVILTKFEVKHCVWYIFSIDTKGWTENRVSKPPSRFWFDGLIIMSPSTYHKIAMFSTPRNFLASFALANYSRISTVNIIQTSKKQNMFIYKSQRLVFTGDVFVVGRALMTLWKSEIGVISGVIRSAESESEESERFHFFRLRLRLRRLWSSEN